MNLRVRPWVKVNIISGSINDDSNPETPALSLTLAQKRITRKAGYVTLLPEPTFFFSMSTFGQNLYENQSWLAQERLRHAGDPFKQVNFFSRLTGPKKYHLNGFTLIKNASYSNITVCIATR